MTRRLLRLVLFLSFIQIGTALADMHFVDANSATPLPPYTNWATAASTIQDAIDVAAPREQVVVTNGVYSVGGRVIDTKPLNRAAINKPLIVQSVNGPDVTIITGESPPAPGQYGVRCAYVSNNALLSGFTLTKGWGDGGGALCEPWGTVSNCVLVANHSDYYGGGYYGGGGALGGLLYNCRLTRNVSSSQGGGAYNATLHNCVLDGNSAGYEGGGACFCDLFNCTLTGNSAYSSGGGAGAGHLYNCIVWSNTARSGPNFGTGYDYYYDEEIEALLDYSFTTPRPTNGIANKAVDPQLASATHLAASSPCIGAGSPDYAMGVDIDGEPWLEPPCIGADQYIAGGAAGPLTVAIEPGYTNFGRSFAVNFTAKIEGRTTASVWDFGDGTIVSNRPFANHAWVNAGSYQVRLTAFNNSFPDGVCATQNVEVSGITHYVDQFSVAPQFPFTNWATAARTIQEAIDAGSIPGRLILVTNGVYDRGGVSVVGTMTNRVALTNPAVLASVNGPAVTMVLGAAGPNGTNGDGAVRCAYIGGGALLSGFTLTNGHTRAYTNGVQDGEIRGGGVWCEYGAALSNCVITGNAADLTLGAGGGVNGGTLYDCTVSNNSAFDGGGVSGSTLYRCGVSANSAVDWGGGAIGCTLVNCVLARNSVRYRGGGAYWCQMTNCTIIGNSAVGSGGPIFPIEGGGVFEGTLYNCELLDNVATDNGGGAYGCTVFNSVLTGNSSYQGGGAYACALQNCTLTCNSARSGGGGAGWSVLNNCLAYYNEAPVGPNYDPAPSTTLNYCCTTPLPTTGNGNIADEPRLASLSHVSEDSPCIGKGSSACTFGTDIDGVPWLDPPCIGASQFVPGENWGPLAVEIRTAQTTVACGAPLLLTAHIEGRVTSSYWNFSDGTTLTNSPYASHAWTAPGSYTVRLTAVNDSFPAGVSATITVQVVENAVHYVNQRSPTPSFPYTSWATAARTLQDAVDAAYAGETVLVTNGLYATGGRAVFGTMTNRVAVVQPIRLLSVNGPLATAIEGAADGWMDGDNAIRCVYLGPNALLSGFTLTNGHTRTCNYGLGTTNELVGGGGVWCAPGAVVSNCVITANSAGAFGGGAYCGTLYNCLVSSNGLNGSAAGGGVYRGSAYDCQFYGNLGGAAYESLLARCRLSGNSATYGGGAGFSTLLNCVLSRNVADYGGGANSSTLYNCTLCANSARQESGGAANSYLYNCIAYYNTAPRYTNCETCELEYSCTTPLSRSGPGNIADEPAFVSWWNDDFRLTSSSPCINAGNNGYTDAGPDLDGNPRISGDTVDMGAYEFQNPATRISIAWLRYYGLAVDGSADYADADRDGMNNWQEWICGTDPTNSASGLKMVSAVSSGVGVVIVWESVTNRVYTLERASDLAATPAFSTVADGIPGQAGTTSYLDTNALGAVTVFYRVGVRP